MQPARLAQIGLDKGTLGRPPLLPKVVGVPLLVGLALSFPLRLLLGLLLLSLLLGGVGLGGLVRFGKALRAASDTVVGHEIRLTPPDAHYRPLVGVSCLMRWTARRAGNVKVAKLVPGGFDQIGVAQVTHTAPPACPAGLQDTARSRPRLPPSFSD